MIGSPPKLVIALDDEEDGAEEGRNMTSDLDMVAGSSMLPGIGLLRSGAVAAAATTDEEERGDDDEVLYPPLLEE